MSGIPGTNVSAMIVPFDDQDIFATHNDKYGRGGFRVCNFLLERDAISDLRRKEGMWVKVIETGLVYELGASLTNADWSEVTLGGGASANILLMTRTNEDMVALPVGTPVFSYSATGVRRAVANVSSAAWKVMGLASAAVGYGTTGQFQAEGVLTATTADWDLLTGEFGGLVANRTYFLHASSVGKITQVPPTGDNEYLCRLGVAYSPTELYVDVGSCIKL